MSNVTDVGIDGVTLTRPKVFGDERGHFFEAFRASWFPGERRWVQWNISRSAGNVVRGLHYHKLQTDYWHVPAGHVRAGLVDIRPHSPTYRKSACVDLEASQPSTLLIPPGVLHGYRIITDATVMYLVDVEYTGKDEYGVKWNDPALGMPASWTDGPPPTLSGRDTNAPMLADAVSYLQQV